MSHVAHTDESCLTYRCVVSESVITLHPFYNYFISHTCQITKTEKRANCLQSRWVQCYIATFLPTISCHIVHDDKHWQKSSLITIAMGSISHDNYFSWPFHTTCAMRQILTKEGQLLYNRNGSNFTLQLFCMTIAYHICHVTNTEKRANCFTFAIGSTSHYNQFSWQLCIIYAIWQIPERGLTAFMMGAISNYNLFAWPLQIIYVKQTMKKGLITLHSQWVHFHIKTIHDHFTSYMPYDKYWKEGQ